MLSTNLFIGFIVYPFVKISSSYVDITNIAWIGPHSNKDKPHLKSAIYFKVYPTDSKDSYSFIVSALETWEIMNAIEKCIQNRKDNLVNIDIDI